MWFLEIFGEKLVNQRNKVISIQLFFFLLFLDYVMNKFLDNECNNKSRKYDKKMRHLAILGTRFIDQGQQSFICTSPVLLFLDYFLNEQFFKQ